VEPDPAAPTSGDRAETIGAAAIAVSDMMVSLGVGATSLWSRT
jgi:hypothetical protein